MLRFNYGMRKSRRFDDNSERSAGDPRELDALVYSLTECGILWIWSWRMAIIPKFFFDAVVAIGLFSNDQDYDWIGTGFLVGKNTVENRADVFLVTSAHIFHQHDAVILRFNNTATNATKDYSLNLFEEDSRAYSVHENADVAAVSISTSKLNDDNSAYSWFSLDDHALTLAQMEKTDVMEGTIVYSLGFPMNLVGNQRKSPICRIGCISRVSDLFQQRETGQQRIFN